MSHTIYQQAKDKMDFTIKTKQNKTKKPKTNQPNKKDEIDEILGFSMIGKKLHKILVLRHHKNFSNSLAT